jgi:hypothetical protein
MTSRPSTAAPILAVVAIVLPMALYVGGYYWLGEYDAGINDYDEAEYVSRDYQQQWVANLYKPVGKVESWLRGIPVQITGPDSGML